MAMIEECIITVPAFKKNTLYHRYIYIWLQNATCSLQVIMVMIHSNSLCPSAATLKYNLTAWFHWLFNTTNISEWKIIKNNIIHSAALKTPKSCSVILITIVITIELFWISHPLMVWIGYRTCRQEVLLESYRKVTVLSCHLNLSPPTLLTSNTDTV